MALWRLHTDADGLVCVVTAGSKNGDFFKALRALPNLPLAEDEIAWPREGAWAYPHMTQGDWRGLGVTAMGRSELWP